MVDRGSRNNHEKEVLSSSVAWMYPFWYFTTVVKVGSKKIRTLECGLDSGLNNNGLNI